MIIFINSHLGLSRSLRSKDFEVEFWNFDLLPSTPYWLQNKSLFKENVEVKITKLNSSSTSFDLNDLKRPTLINEETCLLILFFFHPPGKNATSLFIDFLNFFHPPRLFQPPRLLKILDSSSLLFYSLLRILEFIYCSILGSSQLTVTQIFLLKWVWFKKLVPFSTIFGFFSHPSRKKNSPSSFIDFLNFFPTSSFIPPSTFIGFTTFVPSPCIFPPPRLLERWEF